MATVQRMNAKRGTEPRSPSKRRGLWANRWVLGAAAVVLLGAVVGATILVIRPTDSGDGLRQAVSADIVIESPRNDAVVTGPFDLKVKSPTWPIVDPARKTGAAHWHAFVDARPFTASGEVIPEDPGSIYHFWTDTLRMDLPPGLHRIVVVLGDDNERRIPDATVTAISVTVVK